ncbi:MAG: hypothetical protein OXU51_20360 [Candidatus Poribacteria bacterium]|nr:hypothetical protein [Candidatus Poribacteria bacterium]
MKNVAWLLIFLLSVWVNGVVRTTDAATRQQFQPPLTEEEMLDWLIENNHDAERLPGDKYRIYWRDYFHPELNRTDAAGKRYRVSSFDWGPRGDVADVVVSSSVEVAIPWEQFSASQGLPTFRYRYRLASLKTSLQPVRSLRIYTTDLPRNWNRNISNPPGWSNGGQPPQYEWGSNRVRWSVRDRNYLVDPGESQSGFIFQCQSVPGILTASVWTTGRDWSGIEGIATLSHTETSPRGPIIGPVAIPVETSVLELTRRLETLTSQSVELEWLDASAAAPLQQHLTRTITAFGKNQHSQAKQEIQQFVEALNALEKQSHTVVSSGSPSTEGEKQNPAEPPIIEEALTLLKTNAAYLLTKF